jgi:2,4-dienoyl-CoA reductase-like NADH-dependent reductase (Old Yellow Enzyme family)
MALKKVLEPIKIGAVEIPNRVARTAHATGFGLPLATMSDDLIEYHFERAKGGVGLTILESLMVHPTSPGTLNIGAPGLVEGYRKLVERVRPYGMKLFQQLNHTGSVYPPMDGSPPWSSTDAAGPYTGVRATAMTVAQIHELTAAFVSAAQDAERGGIDGVEVHCAHGYLLNSYLSALHNKRSDDYGGSFENRIRLVREILEGIRAATGPDFALGVRLSSELLPGGMGPDDVIEVAKKLIERGLVDYLNLSVGTEYATHRIVAGMHEPAGYELPFDEPVKRAVNVPVLVTGRFRTLAEADEVIRSGAADIVALTRAHIADPAIVRKTIENREAEIRPCLGCNHGCIAGLTTVMRVGCTVNPTVGSELRLSEELIQRSGQPLRVLVVGGGPAGMEAARVAALSGHQVILAEADSRLGGCVNIAKRAPRRMGIGDITSWLEHEVFRLGVDVRLGTYIESTDVVAIAPDVVIVATGSLPEIDGDQYLVPGEVAKGMHLPHVISSHDLLLDQTNRDWG